MIFFFLANHSGLVHYSCNTMTVEKKYGERKTPNAKSVMSSSTELVTITATKVNSSALRFDPTTTDLVVAITTYWAAHMNEVQMK